MASKPRSKSALFNRLAKDLSDPKRLAAAVAERQRRDRPEIEQELVAPRSPLEEKLAAIWRQVLGVEQVGVRDDFFALGGHSLLATQVLSRVRQAFGVDFTLRDLFRAPTVAALAELTEARRAAPEGRRLPPLTSADRSGELPLSFAQQRQWFLHQLEPESAAYHIPAAVRLEGELEPVTLHRALREIVRRHETLRTLFEARGGRPLQAIHPPGLVPMPVVDLGALDAAGRQEATRELARREAGRPFDLARGPVVRAGLLRLDGTDHVALVTMHHIAGDAWSLGVLVRELAALYEAFSQGRPSPLPELPIQYADFAVWQRLYLAGEALEEELAYWRQQLRDLPPALDLPTDRPRPPVQTYAGSSRFLHLSEELVAALGSLARSRGVTLFMTTLAAFQVLLHRYTGELDLAVGTPIAGRNQLETEGLIGFFANTLVLRGDLAGRPALGELLSRVREVVLAADAHQELPFERLVEELRPQRELSHSPLFQVLFELQTAPVQPVSVPGLTLRPLPGRRETAQFDLTVTLLESSRGILTLLGYNRDLFDGTTVERLGRCFRTLLEAAVADPEGSLFTVPLLAPAESHQVRMEWNDTARSLGGTLLEAFSTRVEGSPEALAVALGQCGLSYRELARRSATAARRLRRGGVGPESVVAILAERGPDFLAALLGILRSGAAYVPLDEEHPVPRQLQVIVGSGAAAVVVAGEVEELRSELGASSAAEGPQWRTLAELLAPVDEPDDALGGAPGAAWPQPDPRSLAYAIYTSGSTGLPKGAMVEHRGMHNHLWAKIRDLGLTAGDVVAQNASQCFDVSVWQLFAPLMMGARVQVISRDTTRDPSWMVAEVDRTGVTLLEMVPSVLRLMLEELEQLGPRRPAFRRLRWLVPTGEALTPELVRDWLALYPAVPLLNTWGATECSDDVTHHLITTAPAPGERQVIGRTLGNFQVYVLDPALRPAPVGVPGELFVAGVGVGRGYLGDPRRTVPTWLPDPFATGPDAGGRLYRTGDLGRYRSDGMVEFVSRLDHQVKVRGFRVEPGEVEAVLRDHPEVDQAVVLARSDGGATRLVAYLVAGGEAASPPALRAYLEERLPDYMVPSAFVVLEEMPLTANGKLDRKALPAPEAGDAAGLGEPFIAPRTPVEEVVGEVWAEVLGLDRVGGKDNFFALGGHSLLAVQVISRVREVLAVEVPVRSLFERPVVAAFAATVQRALTAGAMAVLPPLVAVDRDRGLPASFAQQRLWILQQLDPASIAYNLPTAVELEGRLDRTALARGLTGIVRRHEALRTVFESVDGEPMQRILDASPVPLPVVDLALLPDRLAQRAARLIGQREVRRPFDLSRDCMLRAALVSLGPERHRLFLTMHHVASDGWSMGVLVRELVALYEAFSRGRPSTLPELPVQYADYAHWQRSWLAGETLAQEVGYWRRQLGSSPPVLELPTDRPRPVRQTYRGAERRLLLPAAVVTELRALTQRRGATLFMTLLSGFCLLLQRYSGQQDLVVGTPIAGRNHFKTEGLIGFFVNALALRTNLAGDPAFTDLIDRVREVTLGAYAHQELPFEKLVEELHLQRDLSRSPVFQVAFALQNLPGGKLETPGLTLRPVAAGIGVTKFDLTAVLVESEERVVVSLEHNTDLFDGTTAQRMVHHFRMLLEGAAAEPRRRISELDLLSARERAQMLREWNDTGADCPQVPMVHQRVAAHAAQQPEGTAVVGARGRLSYGELDARANRLAHHLRSLGVGPEVLVALCTDRTTPERVLGILAVLKAGGAYVSLDPTYPRERLAFLLEDARAPVLLTEERFAASLPPSGATVLRLDSEWGAIRGAEEAPPESEVTPDNLAYVVYTSGSTGKPKGVEIPHAGLMNLVRWHQRQYSVTAADHGTQVASPAFDASIWELWPYLTAGATLHIPDEETRLSSPGMVRWWSEEGITLAYLMTPLAEGVLEAGVPQGLEHRVRALIIGGDRLHRRPDPKAGFRLMNHYGPAEYSVTCTVVEVPPEGAGESIPTIGRPVDNTVIHLLDRGLRPVPIGVPGELFVGGVGLARGYHGRPALTAEKLIPDPLADEPGARLYRTGDRVRYLTDGDMDFLGRLDHQVKLRGLRIELGEIESVLGEHPGVREAAVLVREDRTGNPRLVAYLVTADGVGEEEVGRFLGDRLPGYMVPAAFVFLPALPLTANGKVDRRALPDPDWAPAVDYVAPRSPVEEELAAIWAQVLKLDRVGIEDNFFDLGGHSLLASQLISRVRAHFGVEVALRTLFEHPTIEALAQAVLSLQVKESGGEGELDLLLAELESLSEEEAEAFLARSGEEVGHGG